MRWTTNTTTMRERSRRASPQPDYSQLSVDAGSDLENKESNALSASFVAAYHERVQTEQQLS